MAAAVVDQDDGKSPPVQGGQHGEGVLGLHHEQPVEGPGGHLAVDATELRALEHADGPGFDRLLPAALDEHLTRAAKPAGAVQKADADPEVKNLAREVATSTADSRRRLPTAGTDRRSRYAGLVQRPVGFAAGGRHWRGVSTGSVLR